MYKKIYRNMQFIAVFTLIISTITTLATCYTIFSICTPIDKPLTTLLWIILPLSIIIFLIYILSINIASRLAENIMKPIQNAYSLGSENNDVYKEIRPFVKRITAQNKQLQRNIAELKMTEQIRREFSANVSHELKTPLTTIKGYSQIINTGIAKPEDILSFTKKIEAEASRLIILISDIMKLSKLDEGIAITKDPVNLLKTAQEVAERLKNHAEERGIDIIVEGEEAIVNANSVQSDELIYNLIDNAIKYNRENGTVKVFVSDNTIEISDTGIGIPEEYLDRIFERFFRVDKSHSQKINGTGLGLSIVKHIALINNAKINVKSQPGEGTTFTVTFENDE